MANGNYKVWDGISWVEYQFPTSANLVSGLADVAKTGSYGDLANKPTIPTNADYVDLTTYQVITGAKYFTSDFASLGTAYMKTIVPGMNEDNKYNIGSNNYMFAGMYAYTYPFPKLISNGMNEIQQGILDTTSADRFAFIPARNIIIEESIDGGTTWTTKNAADWDKENLFTGKDYDGFLALPTIDGKCNTNCLVRVTITAMNYNVPEGTTDSNRYQYWNEDYATDVERYCNPKLLSVWVASTGNHIQLKVEGHDGYKDTTWQTIKTFDGLSGWAGRNMCSLDANGILFGGSVTQKANYWNWRFTFRTQTNDNDFDNSKLTSSTGQYIYGIRAFSVSTWSAPNNLMESGHLYSWDRFQTMILPGHIMPKATDSNYCGTGSNQFLQVHGKEIWENGTTLADKYLQFADDGLGIPYINLLSKYSTNGRIRTPLNGILPYKGGEDNWDTCYSGIGTSHWRFAFAWIKTINCETLYENGASLEDKYLTNTALAVLEITPGSTTLTTEQIEILKNNVNAKLKRTGTNEYYSFNRQIGNDRLYACTFYPNIFTISVNVASGAVNWYGSLTNITSGIYLHKVSLSEDVSASGGYLVVISKTQTAYTSLADLGNDIVNYNKIISVRYVPAELNGKGSYNLISIVYDSDNSKIKATTITEDTTIIKLEYTNFGSDSVTAL